MKIFIIEKVTRHLIDIKAAVQSETQDVPEFNFIGEKSPGAESLEFVEDENRKNFR